MSFFKKVFGGKDEPKTDQPKKESAQDLLNKMGIDVNALVEQAQQARQSVQAQSQAQSVDDMMKIATAASAASAPASEPTAQFVKKTTCHNCGAAKTLAPKTAYVYCDFCGSLTDYDFQKACENPRSAMPGPAYMQLVQSMQADMAAAKQTKDGAKFKEIQTQLYTKWVEVCPNAVSPRAKKDEAYRAQLVDYMAETAAVNEFDETYQKYAEQVKQQTMAIQWSGTFPKTVASGPTFWPLYGTVKEQLEYSFGLLKTAGVLDMHPDQAPESLQRRMTWSMFCQGWLPVLAEEDSEKMIADAGLKGEYSKLEPVETTLRHCGGCGGELHSIPGAKAMLCEECGTRIDVGNPEVNCKNCAGMISFPVGQNRVQCPFCKSEAQRMSW